MVWGNRQELWGQYKGSLTQALNDNDLSYVINYKSTYEVWNDLIITQEGTSQVKCSKINLLCSQYENFYMLEKESIDEMLTHFIKITNGLFLLGDFIDNDQKVRKVIRVLPKAWEVKVTTLEKLNNREEMNFSRFIGNLKTYEMEMKVREGREPTNKKSIAFKVTPSIEYQEDLSEEGEEDFATLFRKVRRMFYKKGR